MGLLAHLGSQAGGKGKRGATLSEEAIRMERRSRQDVDKVLRSM